MKQNGGKIINNKSLRIGKKSNLAIFSGEKGRVLKRIVELVEKDKGLVWVATVNPEFVVEAKKDKNFSKILSETTINTADGIGIVWAKELKQFSIFNFQFSKFGILGRLIAGLFVGVEILFGKYRHLVASGSELMVDLSREASERGWKVYFLGGFGDTAEKAGKKINSSIINYELRYKTCEGRPRFNDAQVILSIYKYRPEILFVAYGMKKQEEWIYEHRRELEKVGVKLVMGVGRSFDYYSGKLAMAPNWVKRMGMEWLFALVNDPKRWRRDVKLIEFVWDTLKS